MNRRDILVGAGSAAVLAGGGWFAFTKTGTTGTQIEPVTVPTIDAPGSEAGEMAVPSPGTVTVVDLFATYCNACVPQMANLAEAKQATDGDVTFVSVACQDIGDGFTVEQLREWWRDKGGDWTVAYDTENRLVERLDAGPFPHTAIVDAEGRQVWSENGITEPATLIEQIETAMAGDGGDA